MEELKEQGQHTSHPRVGRLLKMKGLRAIQPRRYVPKTTNSNHSLRVCPNLLPDLAVTAINQVWVADMDLRQIPHLGPPIFLLKRAGYNGSIFQAH